MQKKAFYSTLLLCSLIATFQPAISAEDTGTTPGDPAAGTTLQGGVVKVEVTLNDLRDARLSVSRLRKATADLYDEVTRQQVTMNFNPNVVGSTVIMTPSPSFSGAFLPPRPKWVKASMGEIGPIINLFKEDVDAAIESDRRTDVSESCRKRLDPIRDQAFASVKTAFDLYKQLEGLTGGSSYDNRAIADTTKRLDRQVKQLDQSLKRAISILQKEAKASKKA